MSRTNETDFLVHPHESVWTFEPKTERAKSFTRTDLDVEGWQWLGPAFAVDHRLASDLVTALENEGFVIDG